MIVITTHHNLAPTKLTFYRQKRGGGSFLQPGSQVGAQVAPKFLPVMSPLGLVVGKPSIVIRIALVVARLRLAGAPVKLPVEVGGISVETRGAGQVGQVVEGADGGGAGGSGHGARNSRCHAGNLF